MSEPQAKDSKAGGLELVGELLTLAEITQTALVASELLSRQSPDEIKVRVRPPAEGPRRSVPPFSETRSNIVAPRAGSSSAPPLPPNTPSAPPQGNSGPTAALSVRSPGAGMPTPPPSAKPPLGELDALGLPPLDELSGTFCAPAEHFGGLPSHPAALSQSAQPLPPRPPLSALAPKAGTPHPAGLTGAGSSTTPARPAAVSTTSPMAAPMTSPVAAPVASPVAAPVASHASSPVASPVAAPGVSSVTSPSPSASPTRPLSAKPSAFTRAPARGATPPPTAEEGAAWSLAGLMSPSMVELPWQEEAEGGLPLAPLPSAGAELVTPSEGQRSEGQRSEGQRSEGQRAPRVSRPLPARSELSSPLPVKSPQAVAARASIQPLPPPVAESSPEVEMLARLAESEEAGSGEDEAEQVSGSTVHFQVATGTLSVAQLQAQARALDERAQALPPIHQGVEGEEPPPPVPSPILNDLFNAVSAQLRISPPSEGATSLRPAQAALTTPLPRVDPEEDAHHPLFGTESSSSRAPTPPRAPTPALAAERKTPALPATPSTSATPGAAGSPVGSVDTAVLLGGTEGQEMFQPSPLTTAEEDDSDPSLIFAGGTLLPLTAFETGTRSHQTLSGTVNTGMGTGAPAAHAPTPSAGSIAAAASPQGSAAAATSPQGSAAAAASTSVARAKLSNEAGAAPGPLNSLLSPALSGGSGLTLAGGLDELPPNPALLNLSETGDGEGDSISQAVASATRSLSTRVEKGQSVSLPPWETTTSGSGEAGTPTPSPEPPRAASPTTPSEPLRPRSARLTSATSSGGNSSGSTSSGATTSGSTSSGLAKNSSSLSKEELQRLAREALARQKEAPEEERGLPSAPAPSRREQLRMRWQALRSKVLGQQTSLLGGLLLLCVGFVAGHLTAQPTASLPEPQPSPCQQAATVQENVLGRSGLRSLPAPSPVAPTLKGELAVVSSLAGEGGSISELDGPEPTAPAGFNPPRGLSLADPLALPKPAAAPTLDASALADRKSLLNSTVNLGKEAFRSGEYLQSEQYFRQALELATELSDEKQRQWLRWQVGRVWMQLGEQQLKDVILTPTDCQKAHDYFNRAWAVGFTGERNADNLQRAALCKPSPPQP